ncbi:hypothetical protein HIM_00840 [Hirsutella minnesotensis 3608]|nr:hypothetical protein HIM_00840 [Hirsutella minnesotensis 3608]
MSNSWVAPINHYATQHQGSHQQAIKDTFVRRFLTLIALRTIGRLRARDGPCTIISKHLVIKTSDFVHLTEASTLKFIAAKTKIPVPRVHSAFVHGNKAYIVMERIQGQTLADAWRTLSGSQLDSIFLQLRDLLQELRQLAPPPGTGVESCVGGSLRDSRNPRSAPRFGPFKSIHDFHVWLRDGFNSDREKPDRLDDGDWDGIKKMAALQDSPWQPPVFTHGDLNPFNIMVRGDRVTGIIDWESAGWYPSYWEYTAAWLGNLTRGEWQRTIAKFLDPCPNVVLEMEKTRSRWWGDF